MEQLGSHWTDFREIRYLKVFRKSVEKMQVSLKSDKTKEYFTWWPLYIFLSYLAHFVLEWEMFQIKVEENIKIHIFFETCFRNSFCLWDNVKKNTVGQMKMWRMRIACWIPKATNTHTHTHTQYVILIAFPLQQWLQALPPSVTLYVHCLSCLKIASANWPAWHAIHICYFDMK